MLNGHTDVECYLEHDSGSHNFLNKDKKRYTAFTLAEVLITLAVIGIVAAMAIPSLTASYEEAAFRSKLKKVYATLSQALMKINLNGRQYYGSDAPNTTGAGGSDMRSDFLLYMNSTQKGQIDDVTYSGYRNSVKSYYSNDNRGIIHAYHYDPAFIASDGILYAFKPQTATWSVIVVDLNGKKGPNMYGMDVHEFNLNTTDINYLTIKPGGAGSSNTCAAGGNPYTVSGPACTYYMLSQPNMP